jgi:hypothetical protein
MYLSSRPTHVRNISIAVVNGAITLVILLIAPLGLVAVIINTALVTIATYATATIGDRVIRYLRLDTPLRAELMPPPVASEIVQQRSDEIERR